MSALVQIGRAARVDRAKWSGLRPRSAQIYVENRCHLRCSHCYESAQSHPHVGGLSLADYDQLFGELASLGVLFVTLTGGEVFLRKDFLDVVALARKHRFAVTIYTSGTLIDQERADRLAALHVSEVHISVYSHDAALHDAFTHSPGSHTRSLRALGLLQDRGVRVVMKSNVLRFNIDHIDELVALATSFGADIQLDPSIRTRMDGDETPLELVVPPDELARKLLVRPDFASAFRRYTAEELCSGERSILDGDGVICGAARDTLSISADGAVSACGYFPTSAAVWKSGALADIWFASSEFDAVRSMTANQMEECPSCELKNMCQPCMAYGAVEHGTIGACNSASRHGAIASRLLAETKAKANAKMARGRPLPIVGERRFDPPPMRQARPMLATEP